MDVARIEPKSLRPERGARPDCKADDIRIEVSQRDQLVHGRANVDMMEGVNGHCSKVSRIPCNSYGAEKSFLTTTRHQAVRHHGLCVGQNCISQGQRAATVSE